MLLVGGFAAVGWALLAATLTLIICMWLDLVLDLASGLRAACAAAALVLAIALAWRLVWLLRSRAADGRVAERLDAAAGGRGQIVAGVDLLLNPAAARAGGGGATTLNLAQLAIDRAAALAWNVSSTIAVPARPLVKPYVFFGAVLSFIGIAALIAPRLVSTQFARFLDPYGDHPPYSRITFHVHPGHTKVIYGLAMDIRATATGDIVESAELVLESADGKTAEPLPMFPETGGAWRATVANVTVPGRYFIRAEGARSKHFDIGVITVPRLETVRFRITPPAYTHHPPYEGPLPQGGIAGLPGTKVELWAKSNRPLSAGSLTFTPDAGGKSSSPQSPDASGTPDVSGTPDASGTPPVSATPDTSGTPAASGTPAPLAPAAAGSNEVAGSFTIQTAGKVDIGVIDVEGQPSAAREFSTTITVLPDERPFVRMMEPRESSFATPDVTIPVETVGEDDYGVSRVQVYRSLNDSRARPQDIPAPKPEPTRLPTRIGLPLAAYGLKPGDVLKLYARVEDTDPAGAKGSESPVVTIQIISPEQMRQMQLTQEGLEVLTSKYEEAARRMEALDAELEKLQKELEQQGDDEPVSEELKKQMEALAKRAAEEAEAVRESAKDLLPYDIDKNLSPQLENAARKLEEASKGIGEMSKGQPGVGSARGALDAVRKKLGAQREQFKEQATEPLQHLEQIFPLKEDEARFVELYQRQRDLEQRMHSLAQESGPRDDPKKKARMRDLEAEQHKLREDLRDLADDLESHIAALPEAPELDDLRDTAKAFAEALAKSGASEKMGDAEQALADFHGAQAHADAKAAADAMEKLLGKCQGMGDQAGQCLKFSPGLAANLGNTVEQLLQSMGMGSNPGDGMAGKGGGYSARRSTMQNVGLYGGRPTRASWAARSGGGRKSGPGAGDDGSLDPANDDKNARYGEGGRLRATGQSDSVVPAQYRRRVGDYFQRVADEIGE